MLKDILFICIKIFQKTILLHSSCVIVQKFLYWMLLDYHKTYIPNFTLYE
jgi:hypothetical protein